MRRLLVLLAACSASEAAPSTPAPTTFRWAAGPVACSAAPWDVRGTTNQCAGDKLLVVGYPPSRTDPKLSVIRYDGDHAGAPQRWLRRLDFTGEPVVAISKNVVVAVVGKDVVQLAAIALADGKLLRATAIPAANARRVQLEGTTTALHLHVLAADGRGWSVTVDQDTLATASPRDTPARAIRMAMDKAAVPADGTVKTGAFEATWDDADLVVRSIKPGGGWSTTVVADDRFRLQYMTLHERAGRLFLTVHHGIASGAAAFAFDASTGAKLWDRHLTGIGPIAHSAYLNAVASFVDGDQLVVQSVEAGGPYICTVALADGSELACVDHLPDSAIVAIAQPKVAMTPLLPDVPLGPQVSKQACAKSASPKKSLVARTVKGTSTGKTPKPVTFVEGTVVFPSASCKPKLGGGIAGDRVELDIFDGSDSPGAAACECMFEFRTATNKDSRVLTAQVHGGVDVGRMDLVP